MGRFILVFYFTKALRFLCLNILLRKEEEKVSFRCYFDGCAYPRLVMSLTK